MPSTRSTDRPTRGPGGGPSIGPGSGPSPYGSWLLGPVDQGRRVLRVRVQVLLTVLLVADNVVGAGIVFLLSTLVLPAPATNGAMTLGLAIAVPVYVAVAVAFGAWFGTALTLRALRWAIEGRDPDEKERRSVLVAPWRLTLVQAALWFGALVLFTVLAIVLQPGRVLVVAFTIGIAGLVVSAVAYLFSEFSLRPIAARALADEDRLEAQGLGVQRRMQVFWGLGTAAPLAGLLLTGLLVLVDSDQAAEVTVRRLALTVVVLVAIVLLFGLLVTWLNARAVVAPILSVRDALLQVREGDFETSVPIYDATELGMLQSGFNQAVAGLRERERIRDVFGRQVGREVAEAATLGDVELGGESRVVSVLFVDLVGSTTYATEHEPAEVVEMLNRFFTVVVEEVDSHHGLVNKFIGDAVLAVFGAPVELEDHAGQALSAARTMARRLAEEVSEIGAGIGVATGEAVAGNVGDTSRFEYTVIGDAVNSAARLTDLAKDVDGRVLADRASVDAAGDEAQHWTDHEPLTLRGRSEPTETAVPTDT